jgi:hypothetical protein
MTPRNVLFAAACSAALIIPGSLTAQTTRDTTTRRDSTMRTTRQPATTSQQRIRVQKGGEAAGTIVDTRADSIANAERMRRDSIDAAMARQRDSLAAIEKARNDSIANVERMRRDSLAAIERARADSVARADSIAQAEALRRQQMNRYKFGGNGWYVGLAAGASAPTGDFQNLGYNSGFNVNVPIGWHRPGSLLGVRFDFNYNRFSGKNFTGGTPAGSAVTLTNPNPQVMSGTVNLTAAVPINASKSVSLYGVGGAGLYHFRSFGGNSALGGFLGNDVLNTNEANNKATRNKIGAQIGAGLDWNIGTSAVFIESRFVNVFVDRDDSVQFRDFFGDNRSNTLKWVPIVLGVKIR